MILINTCPLQTDATTHTVTQNLSPQVQALQANS